jgi:hypothetical protein
MSRTRLVNSGQEISKSKKLRKLLSRSSPKTVPLNVRGR